MAVDKYKLPNGYMLWSVVLFALTISSLSAQVKIGDNPQLIDTHSILELESATKVLVISRISDDEMQGLMPLAGALIFNTDVGCIFYFDGQAWNNLCQAVGSSDVSITDNGDGTYTIIGVDSPPFVFDPAPHRGSPGSVFFADSNNGLPTEDNNNLFWDDENNKLGIGTTQPENELDVQGIIKSGRIHNGTGSEPYPGYHFDNDVDTGMYSPGNGKVGFSTNATEIMRLNDNDRVGILVKNPLATLHVGGDLRVDGTIIGGGVSTLSMKPNKSTGIRRVSETESKITLDDYTVIIEEKVEKIILPLAEGLNSGHIYILKDLGGMVTYLNISYKDLSNNEVSTTEHRGTIWLQSDGVEWQRIY